MGCKTERSVHAPEHNIKMVAECVVDMECARLQALDCAIGLVGAQMVHMWQLGIRHGWAPKRGVSGMERESKVQDREAWREEMGCKMGRAVHAPEHDGKMVAEGVFDPECA